jgi:hypothetical protein
MSYISIALNIITLIIVGVVIYTINKIISMNPKQLPQAGDVLKDVMKDPSTYIRHIYADRKFGDIGTFMGLDQGEDLKSIG